MSRSTLVTLAALLFTGLAPSARAEVRMTTGAPPPTKLRPAIVLFASDWLDRIPSTGRVNAPDFLHNLYAGQRLTIGLMAEGAERDQLLRGVAGKVHVVTHPGGVAQSFDLKPASVRQIKAQGADMVLLAITAGGVQGEDRAKMESAMSLVSLERSDGVRLCSLWCGLTALLNRGHFLLHLSTSKITRSRDLLFSKRMHPV